MDATPRLLLGPKARARVRDALLAHFDRHARDLPFRRTRDPYAIWVSEVMAQQTRIETVVPYFERFMARFPDLAALASAREDDVLAAFSGLGYYRRARLLHAGAKEALARFGAVPRAPEARRALPGVGRYTAGAIGSIAFGLPEAAVDGNVARVFSRLLRLGDRVGSAALERRLWAEAGALVDGAERPGELNQALMELGATICTPRAPRCEACPVRFACRAHRAGEVEAYPVPRRRAAPKDVRLVVVVATDGDPDSPRVLLERTEGALFGGLFGLPSASPSGDDLAREARAALRARGIATRRRVTLHGSFTHALSHRTLAVEVASIAGVKADEGLYGRAELDSLGVSALTRRALERAGFLEPPQPRNARRARR